MLGLRGVLSGFGRGILASGCGRPTGRWLQCEPGVVIWYGRGPRLPGWSCCVGPGRGLRGALRRWPWCPGLRGALCSSGRGVLASAVGGPLTGGCNVQVSMGVLVGGARRKSKLGRGWGAPTLPPLTWRVFPAGMRAVTKQHTWTPARDCWSVPTDAKQNLSWSE